MRRGPKGDTGAQGIPGVNAQVSQGDGPPSAPPTDEDGYALYLDEATDGNYWIWTPGAPSGAWTDTGIQVSGTDGVAGENAFTLTTAPFVMPAATGNGSVVVNFASTAWMVDATMSLIGQTIFIEGAGYFRLAGMISATQAIIINRRNDTTDTYQENADPGDVIVSGSRVSPGGIQGPAGPTTSITSGAGVPVTDLNDTPGLYVRSGGNYYIWDISGQAWTDTGIAVTGPAGATGSTGSAGYSPVTTTGTGVPSGGTNGDIYFRQVNDGLLQVYTRAGGVWTAGITVLANRLLGFSNSNPTPNPLGLAANAGDQWWTQIGSSVDMWIYNGASWGLAISFTTGGGGATGNFQQVSDASPVLFNGRRTGTRIWTMERAIQFAPFAVNITSLLTTTLDTQYQWQKLSIQVATFALNWSAMVGDVNCEYIFEFTNDTGAPTTITYTAGRWTKSPGVTQPVILAAGEVATIHCYQHQGLMNIAFVEQGVTAI
jgi:hypothetical protein